MKFLAFALLPFAAVTAQYGLIQLQQQQQQQPAYLQQPQPQQQQQQPQQPALGQQPQQLAYVTINQRQGPLVFDGPPPRLRNAKNYVLPGEPQIQQILLPSAVDRQVQRVAQQVAGPEYVQQVQQVQLQAQAQQAVDAARRKQFSNSLTRLIQPIPVPQPVLQPQQQQYLREERYYAPQQPQQPQQPIQPVQQQFGAPRREEQEPEDYDSNPNYQFGFDVKDDLYTNYQNRKEQREGGKIQGSYSVVDSDGFVRTVKYTADPKEGFKAEVTRQPTNIVVKIPPPAKQPLQQQPPQRYVQAVPAGPARQQLDEPRQNFVYQYE